VGVFTLARKNEIFAGHQKAPAQSPIEGVARQDPMKEFGWEVPYELAPLPSKGAVYPKNSALSDCETISIKAMTAREEDILLSKAYAKLGTTVTELLRSCIADKDIDPGQLLGGDRQSILVALRITGYGAKYDAEVSCPSCFNRANHEFDLAELALKTLEIHPVLPGQNEFAFQLPVSKKNVHFKFLTGKDEEELSVFVERRRKLLGDAAENPVTTRLAFQIVSIDGITDKNKISTFVNNMPAADSRALRNYIDKNEPGIDTNVRFDCAKCGADSEVQMPIGASFFWPKS